MGGIGMSDVLTRRPWFGTRDHEKLSYSDNATVSTSPLWTAYKIGIDVLNSRVNRSNPAGEPAQVIDPVVVELLSPDLKKPQTFERLYEAEQRLVSLMSDEDILADASRRFIEAERLGVPSVKELKAQFEKSTTAKARQSNFLVLLDDLHFRYQKRGLDRRVRKIRAKQMNILGLALILPTALIIILLFANEAIENLARYHMIAALWFGLIGAFMSRMIAFQRVLSVVDYDSLVTDFSIGSTLVRLIIGTLGALMMYFLIVGELVGGELFPKWSEGQLIGAITVVKPNGSVILHPTSVMDVLSKEFAKLLVWSTIAGFSERLIPNKFAALELTSTQNTKSN